MRICIACLYRRTIGRSRWCVECRRARRRATWRASKRRIRPARDPHPRCVECGLCHDRRSPRCAACARRRARAQRTVWMKEQRRRARGTPVRDLSPDVIERLLDQQMLRRRPWARVLAMTPQPEAA